MQEISTTFKNKMPSAENMKLSIVIPAYNEEKRIVNTLEKYHNYFSEKMPDEFELFVVVNGCVDNTKQVVEEFGKAKFIDIGKVRGKGAALMEGFKRVDGDYIGFVDADCSTSPEAFYDLYENIKDKDGIIASRWIKGANVSPKQPLKRRIASRTFNLLVRTLFGLKVNDTQCGAKLFTNKSLKEILPRLGVTQWAFDIDLLYNLKRAGYKVTEIPTTWADDPNSNLKLGKASKEMLLSIIRLRLVYSPLKPVLKKIKLIYE